MHIVIFMLPLGFHFVFTTLQVVVNLKGFLFFLTTCTWVTPSLQRDRGNCYATISEVITYEISYEITDEMMSEMALPGFRRNPKACLNRAIKELYRYYFIG